MTLRVLFAGGATRWPLYRGALAAAFAAAGLDIALFTETDSPETVDYIIYAPNPALSDFAPFSSCKAVLSLWAGVEQIIHNRTLTQPLCRMVDDALRQSMVEWVTGHVLRHHLGMDAHILNQTGDWNQRLPPLAPDRRVAVLGLGELGRACAKALVALRFDVLGWSRSARALPGVTCRSGDGGLSATLAEAGIVVLLLPLTAETENLLNADRLARLPRGAVVINPGRGALINDAALLAALDAGALAHATLDVFRVEPLPREHPFWAHPKVTVTPHIASETRPESGARVIAENIRRAETGLPLLYLVDRDKGY